MDNEKKVTGEENKKEETKVDNEEKKEKKETKKPGKVRTFVKKHKEAILTGLGGVALGVGASWGASELAKHQRMKKTSYAEPADYNPLDPNNM